MHKSPRKACKLKWVSQTSYLLLQCLPYAQSLCRTACSTIQLPLFTTGLYTTLNSQHRVATLALLEYSSSIACWGQCLGLNTLYNWIALGVLSLLTCASEATVIIFVCTCFKKMFYKCCMSFTKQYI